MNKRKPTKDSTEILRRINRLSSEADWSVEELRDALLAEGVDPDRLVGNVKAQITILLEAAHSDARTSPAVEALAGQDGNDVTEVAGTVAPLAGILTAAKEQGLSSRQLAKLTGLSVVLITMFDRGMINTKRLPSVIVARIARAINSSAERVLEYLQLGPRFAVDANYKAEDSPGLEDPQDFFEAVRDDPTLSDEERQQLLALDAESVQ